MYINKYSSNHRHPADKNKIYVIFLKKFLKWFFLGAVAVAVLGFAFIKIDTPLAAQLTDDYLRPIFGDRQIVFLEKIFFNFSDHVNKVVYHFKQPLAPQFSSAATNPQLPSLLNLQSLPANLSFAPLAGEGVWHNIPLVISPDKEVMARTFIRPDASRNFAIASLVKMDMSSLGIGSVAGTVEPGGKVGKYGPGKVPKKIILSGNLVAAFDGGFQYRDGQYGMIVGKTTYLPLQKNLGTIAAFKNGSVKIFNYAGQNLSNATFIRQNGPMLIENGVITVSDPNSQKIWGRVVGANTFTWRSGIGITANGNLIFAAGNSLSPLTLAEALRLAGAANAIQLDINPYWVRFNIFNSTGAGKYNSAPLNKEMQDGSKQYLNGYQKDFFYIYKSAK